LIFLFLSLAPGLFVYSPLESYFDPTTQEENQLATPHQHKRRPDFARKIMNRDDERVEEIFVKIFSFFSENLLASSTQAKKMCLIYLPDSWLAFLSLLPNSLATFFHLQTTTSARDCVNFFFFDIDFSAF
jgi:hypothetical protein